MSYDEILTLMVGDFIINGV